MQESRRAALLIPHVTIAGLGILAMLSFAAPAQAADSDYKGWFVALDLAMTQPNSLDQVFATTVDTSASPVVDRRLVMNNDSDLTYQFSVGYGFGRDLGHLKVSYWSFDNEDTRDSSVTSALYPAIFGYGASYVPGYPSGVYFSGGATFHADSKVKARTYDIDYVRPIRVGERFSVNWLAGLRLAKYEENRQFFGDDGAGFTDDESKRFESTAKGLRVGVTGVFGFTRHFSMEASIAASFMQADTDGQARRTFTVPSSAFSDEIRRASDDHIRGEIRDYDLRAVWSYGHVDYYAGYSVSNWDGLVVDPVPSSPNFSSSPASQGRDRQSIAFDSLHAGVTVRFGKR